MSRRHDAGIGLDIGSTTTKGLILSSTGRVLGSHIMSSGSSVAEATQQVLDILRSVTGIPVEDCPIVSTGYGRGSVASATRTVTEITCHSIGVHLLNPSIRLLIDVGGQDSKAIRIGANGRPSDFELNDKCSAGTGRFLEVMARVLGVAIDELGPLALRSSSPCSISSTCTVFAESEVIGRIGSGDSAEDIAAGIHLAMATKVAALSKRLGIERPVGITGGVSLNPAFRYYLSRLLDCDLWTPENPQLTGALGAATLALEQ
ncbi:MAG: 2-hydroxyglutaryl-CoA dehydratase [Candidatus Thorarchaeota archaeon]|nr:2-hydroxyglutaryl-CoA dehydratase [Candidatus Thorarchaeota archaeon]